MSVWIRTRVPVVLAVVVTAALTLGTPAIARSAATVDAHTLDGRPGFGCSATVAVRAGGYVATCASGARKGLLPDDIIRKAPDANKLDGLDSTAFALAANGAQSTIVAGVDLIDTDSSQRATAPPGFSDGKAYCSDVGNGAYFVDGFAPVAVPDGAVITGLEVSYIDDGGSAELNGRVKLVRMPFASGSYRELFSADLANTGAAGEKTTAAGTVTGGTTTADRTVDRAANMYDVVLDQGASGTWVCGMRVSYTT